MRKCRFGVSPPRNTTCVWIALVVGCAVTTPITQAASPEFDGVYIIDDGRPVTLLRTNLEVPAFLQLVVGEANSDAAPETQTENAVDLTADEVRFNFYVRTASSRMPAMKCIAVGPAGYSAGAVSVAELTSTEDDLVWHAQCDAATRTALIFVNLIAEEDVQELFVGAVDNGGAVLRAFLNRPGLDPYFLVDLAALVQRLYPDYEKARSMFDNVSPFIYRHIAQSRQRLLGTSWDQYAKQEKHSYSLAMRNGVDGRGYRLQDYLRDYPSGKFAAAARVEIPERKKAIFLNRPRWAERRAENNLQMVLQWEDNQRKVNALKKYIIAYPHGRLVSLVRTEIGRVSNNLDAGALTEQMTAENLNK